MDRKGATHPEPCISVGARCHIIMSGLLREHLDACLTIRSTGRYTACRRPGRHFILALPAPVCSAPVSSNVMRPRARGLYARSCLLTVVLGRSRGVGRCLPRLRVIRRGPSLVGKPFPESRAVLARLATARGRRSCCALVRYPRGGLSSCRGRRVRSTRAANAGATMNLRRITRCSSQPPSAAAERQR